MFHITILNYGVGNLHSISKAVSRCGVKVKVTKDAGEILSSRCVIFPGVGAFGAASRVLREVKSPLLEKLENGMPSLGICLGMQILCRESEEGSGAGLGFIPERVRRLNAPKIPHLGWTMVTPTRDRIFEGLETPAYFYFAHSYMVPESKNTIATARYGEVFSAAVKIRNTYGVQFHPEKSSDAGLKVIENFIRFAEEESR